MAICVYTTQEDIVSLDGDVAARRSYLSFGSFGGYLHQQAHCSDDGTDGSQKQRRSLGKGFRHDGRVSGKRGQFPSHCLSTLAIYYIHYFYL